MEEAAIQYEPMKVILGGSKNLSKSISSESDLIALTRAGVKKASLKSIASYLGITMERMSSILHTSHRNLQRKDENDLLDSLKSERVLELAVLIKRGIDVIGSEAGFKEWANSPLFSLGNKTPIDFLDTSFGIQMVEKVLGRLEQGVYS